MVQKRVCVVGNNNGWGLSVDAQIIKSILEKNKHFKVDMKNFEDNPSPRNYYDLNFHDELVGSKLYNQAKVNVLSPHQEWFPLKWLNTRGRFDAVLCKNKPAVDIFKTHGFDNCTFTGFTTIDRLDTAIKREPEFLHMAGAAHFKNTETVIDVWAKNPDLPTLNLYNALKDYTNLTKNLPNVKYHFGRVSRETITREQNRCLYHLQPSAAEAFGHVIWEGLSVGAIVITTDAPPMNEATSTIKTKGVFKQKHCLGSLYDVPSLITTVRETLALSNTKQLSQTARNEYETNNAKFETTFYNTIKGLS